MKCACSTLHYVRTEFLNIISTNFRLKWVLATPHIFPFMLSVPSLIHSCQFINSNRYLTVISRISLTCWGHSRRLFIAECAYTYQHTLHEQTGAGINTLLLDSISLEQKLSAFGRRVGCGSVYPWPWRVAMPYFQVRTCLRAANDKVQDIKWFSVLTRTLFSMRVAAFSLQSKY
jgi:hypothetical protein